MDEGWALRVGQVTGIPSRVLTAYASAQLTVDREQPGCRLGWTTVAAIGAIESDHGRHGGSGVGADGYPSAPIIGPMLDGGDDTRAIPDTDSGRLDGDTSWDRAVGSMQFIPSTWARWGSDGNGDGIANPQQVDDAALSAARYLCSAGDLSTAAGWTGAVLSYNHDADYVTRVAATANGFALDARRAG